MEPKRVIGIITTDKSAGGIARAVRQYNRALVGMGYRVRLAIIPGYHQHGVEPGVLDDGDIYTMTRLDRLMLKNIGRLSGGLRDFFAGACGVIVHNSFLAKPFSRAGFKTMFVCHSDYSRNLEYCDHVITLSNAARDAFIAGGIDAKKFTVIPHYYVPENATNPYHTDDGGSLVIASAGRMVDKKGFDDFIRALAVLAPDFPRARFILGGTGELREKFESLALSEGVKVEFPGWVAMADLAREVDIFCLPSHKEPFGFILSEMLDFGVPVVSTDTNGARYMLGGVGGYPPLVQVGNVRALAAAMAEMVASAERRRAASTSGFARIHSDDFSLQAFSQRLGGALADMGC